jgi:hypothetical protein
VSLERNSVARRFTLELERATFSTVTVDGLATASSSSSLASAGVIITLRDVTGDSVVLRDLATTDAPLQVTVDGMDVLNSVEISGVATSATSGSSATSPAHLVFINDVQSAGDILVNGVDFRSHGGTVEVQSVRVEGSLSAEDLNGASSVTFDTCAATSFAVVPGTQATAQNPAAISGDLRIENVEVPSANGLFDVALDDTTVSGEIVVNNVVATPSSE